MLNLLGAINKMKQIVEDREYYFCDFCEAALSEDDIDSSEFYTCPKCGWAERL